MNNKQIGSLGELKVATKFMELGYQVFVELGDNSDIDLITVSSDGEIKKIQVKTTQKIKDGKMEWEIAKSRLNYQGGYKDFYTNFIDGYALYCIENDYIGYVPFEECESKYHISLRIEPTKNSQTKGIKMAEDYKITN